MSTEYQTLEWQESINGFELNCKLDIAIHIADSKIIFMTVPGVDGSVDGYKNKYKKIAEAIQKDFKVATVRISNPFISSHHWQSNLRSALHFIDLNSKSICGHKDFELRIMAHSAGASALAQIAWEYPFISRILLINPASKIGMDKIQKGVDKFDGEQVTLFVGSKDPSSSEFSQFKTSSEPSNLKIVRIDGANHHFSGKHFPDFLKAPSKYLFAKSPKQG